MGKDIRFTEKKVDESWKEQILKDKGVASESAEKVRSKAVEEAPASKSSKPKKETSKIFFNFLNSLGYQVMIHLGEMPHPETNTPQINLEAAREIIDLLQHLQDKTEGNRSPEEDRFFISFLPEIQLKFSSHV